MVTPPPRTADHRLLTVTEACAVLRVSRWTINRLIQSRELRTITIGSRRLVPIESIDRFVEKRTGETSS